jgi:sulfur relay (sulfurtransferase) complex TusBCD TusD component (DsrE family)
VTDPYVPSLAHARTSTLCVPVAILTLVLMLVVEPVWYTEVPSTYMRHPVTFLFEVAEAAIKTGELTVELFAGVETVTLTHEDANTGNEITHRTMESVHRITSVSKKKLCAAAGTFRGQAAQQWGICVLRSDI